jgi:APA family basic amino acid/polyamine antiporter
MTQLRRAIGLADAVGIGVGAIVGAGIFVVSGIAAGMAGPAVVLAILLAGIPATANALSSAQLAASFPQSGGTYEYGYRLLHPWLGYTAGWMFLASKSAAAGTVALGLAAYLDALAPGVPPRAAAVGAVVLFTILNAFGVQRTSRVNLAIVALSVGSLVVLVLAGIPSLSRANFTPFAPAGWDGVLQAAALLFFAYTGYARIATLGEEVREPRRTIPRAIVLSLTVTGVLYAAVLVVGVGVLGAPGLAAGDAPLQATAAALRPGFVAPLVSLGGVVAMLGVMLSQILGLSRMVFAMARRGDLPAALSTVDRRHGVPRRAILLVGTVAAVIAATGTLSGVAAAAAFTILIYYGIANIAALRLRGEARLYPAAVPVIGLVACAVLAAALPSETILTGGAVLATGIAVRFLVRGIARAK